MTELKEVTFADGAYSWSCSIDEAYKQYEYLRSVKLCAGILFGASLAVFLGMAACRDFSGIFLLVISYAVIMLLVSGIAKAILKSPRRRVQRFRMTDDMIQIDIGKSAICVDFRSVRSTEAEPFHVTLYTCFSQPVICIPEADYEPVRDLILRRIEDCSRAW